MAKNWPLPSLATKNGQEEELVAVEPNGPVSGCGPIDSESQGLGSLGFGKCRVWEV